MTGTVTMGRQLCHTQYTVPAKHGIIRIVIMRGGLEGGDRGILVTYDTSLDGTKWRVMSRTIDCDQWDTWRGRSAHTAVSAAPAKGRWRLDPPAGWLEQREQEMRAAYTATINADVIADARAHALRSLLPRAAEEIQRTEQNVVRLTEQYDRWAAEAGTASYAGWKYQQALDREPPAPGTAT